MSKLLTLSNPNETKEFYRNGFWRDDTIYSLVKRHAHDFPDSVAVKSLSSNLTFQQLLQAADTLATNLAASNVVAGQRIGVWLPSVPETVIALVACSRNGYVCTPSLHRDHTATEIVELLTRARAAALIAQPGYGADAKKNNIFGLASGIGTLKQVLSVEPGQLIASLSPPRAELSDPAPHDPNRILYLAFTSGTTGKPKGVMHSDNTLLANARALSTDWTIDRNSVIYSLSPLSHNLGFGAMIMALLVGCPLVLHDLPRGRSLIDRLVDTGTTFLVGVPTHAVDLLAEVKARNLDKIGVLRGFRISGASAPRDLMMDLLKHGVVPQSGYGMTETCSHQYTLPGDDPKLIIETSGRSCPGYQVRIFQRDNSDAEAAVGEIGQIGGKGASLMLGYFDDQAATEDAFNKDGWFMTGDLGWMDPQGYLRITGRIKDVIIRGGHNIYPAKIEALAAKHDAIERAVAVPVPDARFGEKVCLAVMFRTGKEASADDILRHLDAGGLSKYDMPEYFLLIDDIPLTASGKVRKRDIADSIAQGRAQPTAIRWQAKAG